MTTLTLTSAVGSVTVTNNGTADGELGGYEIWVWDPKSLPIKNDMADSKHVDGGDVGNSIRTVGAVPLTVRCVGADHDPDDALVKAVALARIVEIEDPDDGYAGIADLTIDEQLTAAVSCLHDCFRTNADIIRDPQMLQDGFVLVQFTAPCRRQTWTLP